MVCGYFLPTFQAFLDNLDEKSLFRQWLIKGPISAVLLGVTRWWYIVIYQVLVAVCCCVVSAASLISAVNGGK
jgi:hypothetical protein